MTTRTITVDDRRALERQVDRLVVQHDYRLKTDDVQEATLRAPDRGGIWWHVLFLLLTAGFGNVVYALRCWILADTVKIVVYDGGDA